MKKRFSQRETIKDIEKYIGSLEKETSKQPYKPFFSLYVKKRHWANPFKYILGEFSFVWFEKDKQPKKYKNAFELYTNSIDLDTKDIEIIPISN